MEFFLTYHFTVKKNTNRFVGLRRRKELEGNFEILVMLIFKMMITHSNLFFNNEKNIDTIHLKYYLISNIYEIILYSFSHSFNICNFIFFLYMDPIR